MFRLFTAAALVALIPSVYAQEVVLKLHHPLPTSSTAQKKVLQPWCDKIAAESKGRIKCQIFPSMQLGGTAPQLYDQVKDGVVDLTWTIPNYSAGRFPLIEVFELPFMAQDAEGASKAVWTYVEQHDMAEFKDVKPLAFHLHGGGMFHMIKKPIVKRADLAGLKVRAPTRQTNKFIAALGATPVGMPIPQVAEALSKGVIDGTLLPYEVLPAVKADELTHFHSGPAIGEPAIYNSVFILAMNRAKYDSLPSDLRKVIDANSGVVLSGQIGRIFADAETDVRSRLPASSINVIPKSEIDSWKPEVQKVIDGWVAEVTDKGADGKGLLEAARGLIKKYSK
jgi:TRAP-type C4-dicarboxylate transport system substrate-binding protein